MSGEHPDEEHDARPDDARPDDARPRASPAPNRPATPSRSGPAPHRPGVWLAVFLIVVGLTVLVAVVGLLTDAGRTVEASLTA